MGDYLDKTNKKMSRTNASKALNWVSSLYFTEALPYVAVMTLSTIMYTNLGLTNTQMALYTSWLYLPWVIKPFWSPVVDALKTKRWWILVMQVFIGASLAGVALTLQTDMWIKLTLAFFWLMAFSSATHDIAADGFYILALSEKDQALYVGWRSTCYRIGTIFCQGGLVYMAGVLEKCCPVSLAWGITLGGLAVIMLMLALWHKQTLPKGMEKMGLNDKYSIMQIGMKGEKRIKLSKLLLPFRDTLVTFFNKKGVVPAILFMILFRFPEAQLAKMAQPFMLRAMNEGGLGLATETVGLTYGTIGVISLLCGGLLGGYLVSLHGLKRWWWPMILAISLPDAVYIYLAIAQPISMYVINSCVAVEQFGYGLGFTAYTMFLVYFSRGERTTSVFSICTGMQALGMMLPGMLAGYLADQWGFVNFFWWVMACCLVTVVVSAMVIVDDK